MIVVMVNDAVEQCNELSMPLGREPALKDRELQPFAEAFHEPEYAAPAFGICNIVGDEVEMLVPHVSSGREVRVFREFPEQMPSQEACLQLE